MDRYREGKKQNKIKGEMNECISKAENYAEFLPSIKIMRYFVFSFWKIVRKRGPLNFAGRSCMTGNKVPA